MLSDTTAEGDAEYHWVCDAQDVAQVLDVFSPSGEVPCLWRAVIATPMASLVGDDDLGKVDEGCELVAQLAAIKAWTAMEPDDDVPSLAIESPLLPEHLDKEPNVSGCDPHLGHDSEPASEAMGRDQMNGEGLREGGGELR
jgi:hypothetical protein